MRVITGERCLPFQLSQIGQDLPLAHIAQRAIRSSEMIPPGSSSLINQLRPGWVCGSIAPSRGMRNTPTLTSP